MTLAKQLFSLFFLKELTYLWKAFIYNIEIISSISVFNPAVREYLKVKLCNHNKVSQYQMSDRFWPLLPPFF